MSGRERMCKAARAAEIRGVVVHRRIGSAEETAAALAAAKAMGFLDDPRWHVAADGTVSARL